ncbi:hypothetical protein PILCRDRAFT_369655 [Piloderma croceum F 1598]|uniref:Aldehyde dehydrogenase domain-containing protein n=1 Tax=Piloderma croceum (strain F 1598) TaxID=765440 RepID=A0A0C3FLA2_PILCF|nr:hypothetical protein PILCRDRAFT_369655 [Piloderma croceum F 1598]
MLVTTYHEASDQATVASAMDGALAAKAAQWETYCCYDAGSRKIGKWRSMLPQRTLRSAATRKCCRYMEVPSKSLVLAVSPFNFTAMSHLAMPTDAA